MYYSGVELR